MKSGFSVRSNQGSPVLAPSAVLKIGLPSATAAPFVRQTRREKCLVGCLFLVPPGLGEEFLCFLRCRFGRLPALHRGEQQIVGHDAVELQVPALASVTRVQDHAAVTDRPAMLVVGEEHRRQIRRHRYRRLLPRRASVDGDDDMPALADGDDAIARSRHRLQQASAGQRRHQRRCVQHVGEAGADRPRGKQRASAANATRRDQLS